VKAVAVDVGERTESKAQFVDSKTALLALELRLELFSVGERTLSHLFGVANSALQILLLESGKGAIA